MPDKITGKLFSALFLSLIYAPFIYWLFQSRFPFEDWDRIIPVISLIIAFLNYRNLRKDTPQIMPDKKSGVIFLIIAVLLKIIVFWRASYFLEMFSFLSAISGTIIYFYGWKVFNYFIFPLAFLLLKLPWDAYILKIIDVRVVTSFLARLTAFAATCLGFPSQASGILVLGPQVNSNIIDRCSGLYTLTAKCLFGYLFIYYSNSSLQVKFWKSLAVIPIIQLINLLRIISLHIAFNILLGRFSAAQIHQADDLLHKTLLIAILYFYAFGFSNKKKKPR